jgi:N-succinyldiaminopimelate aminotransferase
VCIEHDLIAITDEVYEHLVFDGAHVPLATLDGMWERTITISSLGKTFSCTGWKIGWATGPAELVAGVRAAKQFLTFAGGTPFQHAGAVALGLPGDWYTAFAAGMRAKRDRLSDGLAACGLRVIESHGTYFVNVLLEGGEDGTEFCRALPERAGVVAIPTAVFYEDPAIGHSLVRFTFCKRAEVLDEGVSRLRRALSPA